MLACMPTGSSTLSVLAWAPRATLFATTSSSTTANFDNVGGAYWYHTNASAMGFADSSSVSLSNCDTAGGSGRICLHLNNFGGYRCGSTTGLNNDSGWVRVLYTGN